MVWGLYLACGVGLSLGGGFGGLMWWDCADVTFYMTVFRAQRAPPPIVVGVSSWFLMHLVLALMAFFLQKKEKKKKRKPCTCITLFGSITKLCENDNIPWIFPNISHIGCVSMMGRTSS